LNGEYSLPGDKSISHRALLISAIAEGTSTIEGCSTAADPRSTRSCLEALGVKFYLDGPVLRVEGQGLKGLTGSKSPLDAGNSGTTIRLLSGVLAGQKFSSKITGDVSLSRRPMRRVFDPLRLMGANIHGTDNNTAPLFIQAVPGLHGIDYTMPFSSAQVKSAVLFAGAFAEGTTCVREKIQTRDHTERMLGLTTTFQDGTWKTSIEGGKSIPPQTFFVPGDISAAAFFIAAALIVPHSSIRILNVGLNPTRTELLNVLMALGASIEIINERVQAGERIGDLLVRTSDLSGDMTLEGDTVAKVIDEIPVLAIAALFSKGTFRLKNAEELRRKESDRISSMVVNLRAIGAEVEEYEDGFCFESGETMKLHGARIESYDDHRIAMAFGIAGLRIQGMNILRADCVDISFPNFWRFFE
jgi:3-phosphoshikimate 1-carboxyvinyltransferase